MAYHYFFKQTSLQEVLIVIQKTASVKFIHNVAMGKMLLGTNIIQSLFCYMFEYPRMLLLQDTGVPLQSMRGLQNVINRYYSIVQRNNWTLINSTDRTDSS